MFGQFDISSTCKNILVNVVRLDEAGWFNIEVEPKEAYSVAIISLLPLSVLLMSGRVKC